MSWTRKVFALCSIAVGVHYFKQYMNGPMCTSNSRIDGKVVLITGGNTGIGKETAIDLLRRGGKVYIACRSMERANQAVVDIKNRTGVDDTRIQALHLDLNSLQSVRQFVADFKKKEARLNILINNAGIFLVPYAKTADGFESTFGVNHLGHFLLTHLLMDLLVAASPSRIINVSAKLHEMTSSIDFKQDVMMEEESYDKYQAYYRSKLANILFTRELAKRLKGTGVTVYSLHPGVVQTELHRSFAPYFVVRTDFGRLLYHYATWSIMKDEIHGAQTQICCAVDEKLARESGYYYSDCARKEPSAEAQDNESAIKLWNISAELVKLNQTEIFSQLR